MEKSIEKIWKEGFMMTNRESLPIVKDIASFKSIYFIDKFKRRFSINIILLVLTAIVVLFAFILGGIPFVGIYMFLLFSLLAIIGKAELSKLDKLEKGKSSYEYMKKFDGWLKNLLSRFALIYRFMIPLLFVGFILGILKTNLFIPFIGSTLTEKLVELSEVNSFGGVPVLWLIGILISAYILSFFSNNYFRLEMKSIYGDLILKLDNILAELEELK